MQLSYRRYFTMPQTLEFIFSPLILQQMKHHQTKHIMWERIWRQGKNASGIAWSVFTSALTCLNSWRNTTLSSSKHTRSLRATHPPPPKLNNIPIAITALPRSPRHQRTKTTTEKATTNKLLYWWQQAYRFVSLLRQDIICFRKAFKLPNPNFSLTLTIKLLPLL